MSDINKIINCKGKIITIDKFAGFCFGVKNACDTAFKRAVEESENEEKSLFSLGPLIHNEEVTKKLSDLGVIEVNSLEEVNNKSESKNKKEHIVILRSHGVGEGIYKELSEKNVEIIDCTCPFVKKIHNIVKEYYNDGYHIIIVGDPEHPEVIGILGWCGDNGYAIKNQKDVDFIPVYDKICLVAQTTITKKLWDEVRNAVEERFPGAVIKNTICSATSDRQNSAMTLSKKSDLMVIIGSKKSSNTNKLLQVCQEYCENTLLISGKGELNPEALKDKYSIGVTAGASTPDWIIKEVVLEMEENIVEIVEEEIVEDQASMMEAYMRTLHTGEIVTGSVLSVQEDMVMVNIGYKHDGLIKKEEFTWDSTIDLRTLINVGDDIEVSVLSINDGDGNVLLSKKAVDAEKNWHKIEFAFDNKIPVDGTVRQIVKGGVIADVYGIKAFVPASQLDLRFSDDLSKFMNLEFKGYIVEFIKEKRKVVVSRKEFLKEEREVIETKIWSNILEGQKISGEVKRLADFGAFVDIGGIDGLVHISELSWSRVKHPSEILKVGEKIDVIVLSLDRDKKKVSLGYKSLTPAPWTKVSTEFAVDDIIDVKVLRMTDFGAFVEIIPGVDGLIHVSQIANKRIGKPSEILKVGEIVKAKIIDIKPEDRKISLSIKATLPEEEIVIADAKPTEEIKEEVSVKDAVEVAATIEPVEPVTEPIIELVVEPVVEPVADVETTKKAKKTKSVEESDTEVVLPEENDTTFSGS